MVDSGSLTRVTWLIQIVIVVLCTLLYMVHSQSVIHRNQPRHANRSRTLLLGLYRELNLGRHFRVDPGVQRLQKPSILESEKVQKVNGLVSSLIVTRGGTLLKTVMTFNLSQVTAETLRKAELHVSVVNELGNDLHLVNLKVRGQRSVKNVIDLHSSSDADVTKVIRTVLASGDKTISFQLKLRHRKRKFSGIEMRQLSTTFLVLFSESRRPKAELKARLERFTALASGNRRKKRRKPTRGCHGASRCLCRKHDLTVDLSRLGWQDRVVYPAKFNAFYCDGRCPTLIDMSYTPTNHAIIQSLYRLVLTEVPRSRCVPVKLRPLSMLYYENNELVLKHHDQMIVEECGCR